MTCFIKSMAYFIDVKNVQVKKYKKIMKTESDNFLM